MQIRKFLEHVALVSFYITIGATIVAILLNFATHYAIEQDLLGYVLIGAVLFADAFGVALAALLTCILTAGGLALWKYVDKQHARGHIAPAE